MMSCVLLLILSIHLLGVTKYWLLGMGVGDKNKKRKIECAEKESKQEEGVGETKGEDGIYS